LSCSIWVPSYEVDPSADYTGIGLAYGKLGSALIPILSPRRDQEIRPGGAREAGDAGG
jgi:hypothetical protein